MRPRTTIEHVGQELLSFLDRHRECLTGRDSGQRTGDHPATDLTPVRLRVGHDLVPRQRRTRGLLPRRIADHPREIADEKNDAVPHLLEVPHLADHHRVPEVNVRRRRIEAHLHRQRLPAQNLRLQIVLLDQVDRSLGEVFELFVESHGRGF